MNIYKKISLFTEKCLFQSFHFSNKERKWQGKADANMKLHMNMRFLMNKSSCSSKYPLYTTSVKKLNRRHKCWLQMNIVQIKGY